MLVPAHDEELVLAATLESLHGQEYPAGTCPRSSSSPTTATDATAAIARRHGATVLERSNRAQRGKGYALDWALDAAARAPRRAGRRRDRRRRHLGRPRLPVGSRPRAWRADGRAQAAAPCRAATAC